jgi:hypothetical protein
MRFLRRGRPQFYNFGGRTVGGVVGLGGRLILTTSFFGNTPPSPHSPTTTFFGGRGGRIEPPGCGSGSLSSFFIMFGNACNQYTPENEGCKRSKKADPGHASVLSTPRLRRPCHPSRNRLPLRRERLQCHRQQRTKHRPEQLLRCEF